MSARLTQEQSLRALMTADAVGGVWQYALDLADGLRPHGVETWLALLGPEPSAAQRAAAHAVGVTLLSTGLPLDWTADNAEQVEQAGRAIARMASEGRPDIIHLNSPSLAALATFQAPVVTVAHSCVATWWNTVRTDPLPPDFIWRADLARRGYHAADAVLAPTAAFAQATAAIYDLPRAPQVVHNGRRPTRMAAPAEPAPFVFTAGRLWDEGKNLAVLDRAASRLSVPVLAAGAAEGPNGARIGLQHTRLLGQLDDRAIAQHLSQRPIFVSTAHYEPFGLAVLEAAQAGCALVLSDIPAFRELWDGAAAFVPVDDDEIVACAVKHLLRDPHARRRLGARAKVRSAAYSVDAMCAGVLEIYRSLLAARADISSVETVAA